MGTFNLRRFSKPGVLKSMRPESLRKLLAPYRTYLESRDFAFPSADEEELFDYPHLAEVLVRPTAETPRELVNALFYIDELSTPTGQESLQAMPGLAQVFLSLSPQATPVDVAVRCWLHDRRAVAQAFGESRVHQPRAFEYSHCQVWPPKPMVWTEERRSALESGLEKWFVERRRGRGVWIHSGVGGRESWFVVHHGDPYRREGSLEQGESKSVLYRPEKFDVLVYNEEYGELRVNAASKGEKDLYRRAFGEHLFGDVAYFGPCGKYTLEPLRRDGPAALVCSDVEGLELVVLKELSLFWGGAEGEEEIRRARDLMAVFEDSGRRIPDRPRLRRAKFEVKFSGGGRPRMVTIYVPDRTSLTRDADGALVEEWLRRRGFVEFREGFTREAA